MIVRAGSPRLLALLFASVAGCSLFVPAAPLSVGDAGVDPAGEGEGDVGEGEGEGEGDVGEGEGDVGEGEGDVGEGEGEGEACGDGFQFCVDPKSGEASLPICLPLDDDDNCGECGNSCGDDGDVCNGVERCQMMVSATGEVGAGCAHVDPPCPSGCRPGDDGSFTCGSCAAGFACPASDGFCAGQARCEDEQCVWHAACEDPDRPQCLPPQDDGSGVAVDEGRCVGCRDDEDCSPDDDLLCNGLSGCREDVCTLVSAPCGAQLCSEEVGCHECEALDPDERCPVGFLCDPTLLFCVDCLEDADCDNDACAGAGDCVDGVCEVEGAPCGDPRPG